MYEVEDVIINIKNNSLMRHFDINHLQELLLKMYLVYIDIKMSHCIHDLAGSQVYMDGMCY